MIRPGVIVEHRPAWAVLEDGRLVALLDERPAAEVLAVERRAKGRPAAVRIVDVPA